MIVCNSFCNITLYKYPIHNNSYIIHEITTMKKTNLIYIRYDGHVTYSHCMRRIDNNSDKHIQYPKKQ